MVKQLGTPSKPPKKPRAKLLDVKTFKRSQRIRSAPKRLKEAADEDELLKEDPDIDSLVPAVVEYDNDNDWLPNVPGRPSPFPTTWSVVYGHRAWSPPHFVVGCQEGCSKDIFLNGKLQEIDAGSTPHGKPRRPPVCHNISWAALEYYMLNMQSERERLQQKPAKLRNDFVRAVCWEPSNLRPGHNACNAGGTKTTAQNVSAKELSGAEAVVNTVVQVWNGSIWEM